MKAIPDGWFRGDLARQDVDSYLFIVDRKKEMIIRGGENVYPREIEEALYEHPAVAEVVCVGIPDADLGEEVGAAVVLKPGAAADPDELRPGDGASSGVQVPATRVARRRCPTDRPKDRPSRGRPPRTSPASRSARCHCRAPRESRRRVCRSIVQDHDSTRSSTRTGDQAASRSCSTTAGH